MRPGFHGDRRAVIWRGQDVVRARTVAKRKDGGRAGELEQLRRRGRIVDDNRLDSAEHFRELRRRPSRTDADDDGTESVRGQLRSERLRSEGDDHGDGTVWSQSNVTQAGRHAPDHRQRLVVGDAAPPMFECRAFGCLHQSVEKRLREEPHAHA